MNGTPEVHDVSMLLPGPPTAVWAFFTDPHNLEAITPPWLRFRVLSPRSLVIREGALIDYRLRWRGLPIRWRTLISRWEPPDADGRGRFVDEQLRGPYRLWRHTHEFEPRDGHTLMRDRVEYLAPLAWLAHPLVVRRDVRGIFEHRAAVLRARFGEIGQASTG